jgi:hypothetical protein
MNIIILEDYKGFRKTVEVSRFTPDYRIVKTKPLDVYGGESGELTPKLPVTEEIIFYPQGKPIETFGTYTMLYKELFPPNKKPQ